MKLYCHLAHKILALYQLISDNFWEINMFNYNNFMPFYSAFLFDKKPITQIYSA